MLPLDGTEFTPVAPGRAARKRMRRLQNKHTETRFNSWPLQHAAFSVLDAIRGFCSDWKRRVTMATGNGARTAATAINRAKYCGKERFSAPDIGP